jgi:hypothetical protein
MTSDAISELDLHKEEVAELISITQEGRIIPKVNRDTLDLPTEILLILIGRTYAAAAGLAPTDEITNKELTNYVKGSPGGQRWALGQLRNERLIVVTGRGKHRIIPARIGAVIKIIREKIKK